MLYFIAQSMIAEFNYLAIGGGVIVYFVLNLLAFSMITYSIKNKIDGISIGILEAWKKTMSCLLALIYTNILVCIFLLPLFLLLIIPGIIYSVKWISTSAIVVLSNKSGKAALDYSKQVTKGRWWRISTLLLIYFIILFVLQYLISLFPVSNILFIADIVITSLFGALYPVLIAVLFINLEATTQPMIEENDTVITVEV